MLSEPLGTGGCTGLEPTLYDPDLFTVPWLNVLRNVRIKVLWCCWESGRFLSRFWLLLPFVGLASDDVTDVATSASSSVSFSLWSEKRSRDIIRSFGSMRNRIVFSWKSERRSPTSPDTTPHAFTTYAPTGGLSIDPIKKFQRGFVLILLHNHDKMALSVAPFAGSLIVGAIQRMFYEICTQNLLVERDSQPDGDVENF